MTRLRILTSVVIASLAMLASLPAYSQPRGQTRRAKPTQKSASRAATFVVEADKLAAEKKWMEAIDVYRVAIRLDPNYEDAYAGMGDTYLNNGKWDDAAAAYKEQIRVAPTSADAHYHLGHAYNVMGRYTDAIPPLTKAVSLDPRFPEAHYETGFAYMRALEFEKSIGFFKSAIRLKPDYAEAIFELGSVFVRLGNFTSAGEQQRALTSLDSRLAAQLTKDIQQARGSMGNGSMSVANSSSSGRIPASGQGPNSKSPTPNDARFELSFWESIRNSNDPADYRAYLEKFPNGVFADLARRRSAAIESKTAAVATSTMSATPSNPAGSTSSTRNTTTLPPSLGGSNQPATSQPISNVSETRPSNSLPASTDRSAPAAAGSVADRLGNAFGLSPGASTRTDAARLLGQPVRDVSASMAEYNPQPGTGKIYVEYQSASPTINRIEVYLPTPVLRADMLQTLRLPEKPQQTKPDSKGRLIEYFGAPRFIAISHVSGEGSSGVNRIGYFSEALFNEALGGPRSETTSNAAANPASSFAPTTSGSSNPNSTANSLPASVTAAAPPAGGGLPPSIGAGPTAATPAEKSWTIPSNTIVLLRLNNGLSSKIAKANDAIAALVSMPVIIDGQTVLAAGTLVEGKVTQAKPAGRMGKPGVVGIDFGEIVFKNSSRVKLIGTLTAANVDPHQKVDPEGEVKAKNKGPQPALIVGGGAGIGAAIGGATGGAAGAGIGAATGAGVGLAASMLTKGPEAELKPGFPFGIQLSKAVVVSERNLAEAPPK